MRKFLKKIFLFIILFIFVNLLFLYLVRITDWNFIKRIESQRFNNRNYKCIILGNSLAFDAIDSKLLTELGISSYNLALEGATIKTSYIQLKEYLKNNRNPEFVLLGLGTGFNNQNFDEEGIQPIVNYTANPIARSLKENIPMVRYKWLGMALLKKVVFSSNRNAKIEAGHLNIIRIRPDNTLLRNKNDTLPEFKYKNSIYISNIVNLCNEHNITLILLEMPVFKENQNDIPFGPHRLVSLHGTSMVLFNLNNSGLCEIFDSQKDWLGGSHLNSFGAEKLTRVIYKDILLNYSADSKFNIISK